MAAVSKISSFWPSVQEVTTEFGNRGRDDLPPSAAGARPEGYEILRNRIILNSSSAAMEPYRLLARHGSHGRIPDPDQHYGRNRRQRRRNQCSEQIRTNAFHGSAYLFERQ